MIHLTRHYIFVASLVAAMSAAFVVAATHVSYRIPNVNANGFTVPIAQGIAGPYEYLVGIWPPNPGVGDLHVAVTLTADERPVTDAVVSVRGDLTDPSQTVGPADAANYFQPWVYELNVFLDQPGEWMFEISIDSPVGKTVLMAPLEVSGEPVPLGQDGGRQPVINGAQPGQESIRQPAVGEATPRPGEGTELLDLMSTREAAKSLPEAIQPPEKRVEGSQEVTGDSQENGGTSWAIVAVPLGVLALGATAWAIRRQRRPEPSPAGSQGTKAERRRRKK